METLLLFRELENLVKQMGISIRYENFVDSDTNPQGGMCILKGKPILFLENLSSLEKRIDVFVHCLIHFDLQDVFIKPAVRDYLMNFKKEKNEKGREWEKKDTK